MKKLALISLILSVMLLVSVTGLVSAVSPTVVTFHPGTGWDDSDGGYSLTAGDLTKVAASDNQRYESGSQWTNDQFNDNDYIDFSNFGISLPADAIIDSVKLKFEWQREIGIDAARIRVYVGTSLKQTYDLTPLPAANTDEMVTKDLSSYITTAADLANLKVRFQAHNCPPCESYKRTRHDLVEIVIEYHLCEEPPCELTIDEPTANDWFDSQPVPIKWHLSEGCTPIDEFDIWYEKDGNCNPDTGNWFVVESDIAPGEVDTETPLYYAYLWDKPLTSGQYCVKVKVSSNGARDVSEKFNVDLAPPVVHLSVGNPKIGECDEEETGDCYINKDTDLTLTCADNNPVAPWQSGVDKIEYRYSVDGGDFTDWEEYEGPFSFPEDTNHVLEYRCFDNVGKKDEGSKELIVDSVGPKFVSKTVGQPSIDGCDVQFPGQDECDYYVTQDTEICVSYKDPTPHPVDDVTVYCEATVWETLQSTPYNVKIPLDEEGCFKYKEDSYHELHCWALDALENKGEDLYEADIVETVPPVTRLGYEGPFYSNEVSNWIDTISNITLSAVDPQPHPVDDVTTYYRYGVVDNKYCYGTQDPFAGLSGQWLTYTGPFGLPESCQAIEYYSEDALGNSEDVQVEFVFSDHTAPETVKVVGEPSEKCGLFNDCGEPIWDWYENPGIELAYEVTLDTVITMSCEDQQPHPSGVGNSEGSGIWYRVVLDGKYDDPSAKWQFVHDDEVYYYFPEQSEHLLEFYCVDNVGKKSDTDSELFKVTGEEFTLEIGDKWDLISVPFQLIGDGDVEDVFDNSNIVEVWSYEGGEWKVYSPSDGIFSLDKIVPGRGYWVKTTDGTTVLIGGTLMKPASVPPSVELDKGWNLIGHYDLSSRKAYCSLFSLVDTQQGFPRWSALWGYNSASQTFIPLTQWDYTNPGRGYWLEMDVEDSYSPSSICYGFI